MINKKSIKLTFQDGRCQKPRDNDFNITPSLVFGYITPKECDNIGYGFGVCVKFGFWFIGIKILVSYLETNKVDVVDKNCSNCGYKPLIEEPFQFRCDSPAMCVSGEKWIKKATIKDVK